MNAAARAAVLRAVRIAVPAVLALIACKDEPKSAPPPARDPLVVKACECTDLRCIDGVQQAFVRRRGGQHETPEGLAAADTVRAEIDRCAAPLIERVEREIVEVTEALCACADRACYEALRPRVDAVFSRENAAAFPPEVVERVRATVARFQECDERFSAP